MLTEEPGEFSNYLVNTSILPERAPDFGGGARARPHGRGKSCLGKVPVMIPRCAFSRGAAANTAAPGPAQGTQLRRTPRFLPLRSRPGPPSFLLSSPKRPLPSNPTRDLGAPAHHTQSHPGLVCSRCSHCHSQPHLRIAAKLVSMTSRTRIPLHPACIENTPAHIRTL